MVYVNFWATLVIVKPCISEKVALIRYRVSRLKSIAPILPKFVPSPPDSLLIKPLNISVVAFPNIFGPTIENIVLPIANIITIATATLYFDK